MLAYPRMLWRNRHFPRLFSTLTPTLTPRDLINELKLATDNLHYIDQSATTIYLETDPADRQPRAHYIDHYRMLALQQLENVIALHDQVEPKLFPHYQLDDKTAPPSLSANADTTLKDDLRLSLADALLARDKLRQALEE